MKASAHTAYLSHGPVHYRAFGPESARVLLFVHGLFVDGTVWDPVVERLAERYRCIVPDLPMGSHRTAMAGDADLSPSGMAVVVADFMESLDLRDVVLVGNDSGGAVCQLLMTTRPERIGALVLTTCDAFEVFPPSPFGLLVALARHAPPLLRLGLRLAVAVPALTRLPFAFGRVTKRPLASERAVAWLRPSAEDRLVCRDVCKFMRGFEPALTLDAGARLSSVRVPALVVWASEDRSFPLALGRRLNDRLPSSELVEIPDALVFASIDAPAPVAAAVRGFVERLARSRQEADPRAVA